VSTPIVNPVPLPYGDPITTPRKPFDGKTLAEVIEYLRKGIKGFITDPWSQALDQVEQQVAASPTVFNRFSDRDINAAIATTDLAGAALGGALYKIEHYLAVITPAGVSSSITLTIGWTYNGVLQSFSYAAMNGNLTTTFQSGSAIFRADASTPITYAISYASNPAGAMHYSADIVLSRVTS
jgi:hypothetical protein